MKIIIEGCDGSGKSTLARRLATIFNARIEHDSEPKDLDNYMDRLQSDDNIIFDRFFLGQFIYNKPEERKLSEIELFYIKHYCLERQDIILIYFDQDTEVVLKRLESRSDSEKEKDKATMRLVGKNNPRAFVEEVKRRYKRYIDGFIILKGDDIIYE